MTPAGFSSPATGAARGLDQALWKAQPIEASRIVFQPAVNEDLAATAVWGTQQLKPVSGPRYDGVFALWYGKGPGVDRCGDVSPTPTPPERPAKAVCWSSPATITRRNPRPCHTRPSTSSGPC